MTRSKKKCFDFVLYRHGLAKNAKTGQTNVQFNSSSTGGSIESFPDARDQAKEAKNQEAPRGGSQASEEAEEAKREEGPCGRSEKRIPLAVFQRGLANPMRPPPPSVKAIAWIGLFGAVLSAAW